MENKGLVVLLVLLGSVVSSRAQTGCLGSTNAIAVRENQVTDFSLLREYTLCRGTTYEIGTLSANNEFILNSGQAMFPIRSNMYIKCGNGGANEGCFVSGGDVQVDGTNLFGNDFDSIHNVTFEGFTFQNTQRYGIWATKPGSITFRECTFKSNTLSLAPLFFDYYNPERLWETLDVSFVKCAFENNVYWGEGSSPAIVTANGVQNSLEFHKSLFNNNDYIFNNTNPEESSFLVESSGRVVMTDCCFENNQIGVSPVSVYGNGRGRLFEGNYGISNTRTSCTLAAVYETAEHWEFSAPLCENFDSTICRASITSSPSASPSSYPSEMPSLTPSVAPSEMPSSTPSLAPSPLASETPSMAPSAATSPQATMAMLCSTALAAIAYILF